VAFLYVQTNGGITIEVKVNKEIRNYTE